MLMPKKFKNSSGSTTSVKSSIVAKQLGMSGKNSDRTTLRLPKLGSEKLTVINHKLFSQKLMKDYVVEEDSHMIKISQKHRKKLNKIKERKRSSLPARHPEAEARTIYVGNVNIKTNRRKLEQFFSKYGKVESVRFRGIAAESITMTKKEAIIMNKLHPQKTSITAYVRFQDKLSKEKALDANGELFEELHIRVDSASLGSCKEENSIFVGNLSWEAKDEDLWDFFKDCGKIKNVRIVRSATTGAGKGFAFVSFDSNDGVQMALYLNGKMLLKRPLRVKIASKENKIKGIQERKPNRRASGPNRRASGTSSLIWGKSKGKKMDVAFLKQDKPQRGSDGTRLKKKKRKHNKGAVIPTNFAGSKVVEDGEVMKKKRARKTKAEIAKMIIARKLAYTS